MKLGSSIFITLFIATLSPFHIEGTLAAKATAAATPPSVKNVQQEEQNIRKLTSLDLAIAGSVATMLGDAAMQPIDCIKTLQQSNEGIGLNMLEAGKRIYKNYGFGGFYSGLGAYVVADGGAGAVKFATYEALKQWVNDNIPEQYIGAALFGCAALAFIASSLVLVPGEMLKQKLQMGQINSLAEGIPAIFAEEGIRGFFHGYSGVCLRDIPYTMMELGIYDNLKSMYLDFKNRNAAENEEYTTSILDDIIAAAISGMITGYLTAPMDNIKTKLMVNADLYKGFIDCTRKCIAENGVFSLFNGGAARVAWLMPFTAIYLPAYEIFKKRMQTMFIPSGQISLIGKAATKKSLGVAGGAMVPASSSCSRTRRCGNKVYTNVSAETCASWIDQGKRKLISF